ncbi:hypothetical protein QAD02_003375 [Eretmocerus hayati]|uniref:Uncharacterized protein n=1 Tax=Eretmocerus hayati TaxID=131215 RepID=A0ACC2NND0_9HYME|nr:hypothetical protein QAD02_003375 [Eretmocerus hayati]
MEDSPHHSGDIMDHEMDDPDFTENKSITDSEANTESRHEQAPELNNPPSSNQSTRLQIPPGTRYPHSTNLDKLFKQAHKEGFLRPPSLVAPKISAKKRNHEQVYNNEGAGNNANTSWQLPKRPAKPPASTINSEASFNGINRFSALDNTRACAPAPYTSGKANTADFRTRTFSRSLNTQTSATTFEYEWPQLPNSQRSRQSASQKARTLSLSQRSDETDFSQQLPTTTTHAAKCAGPNTSRCQQQAD